MSLILSLTYILIFLMIFISLRKKPILLSESSRTVMLYVISQWLIISLFVWTDRSLVIHMLIAIALLLFYISFTQLMSILYTMHVSYKSVQKDISHFEDTILSIRAQRHDFLKHVNALHYFLEEHHYEQADRYMKNLIDDYDVVNQSIKGEKGHIGSLLFQQSKRAAQEQVNLIYRLNVPTSRLPLQPIDQMNLLANLLENAIDAAAEATIHPKEVILSTSIYGGIYRLEIMNTTNPIPYQILNELFQTYNMSTKGDEHEGLGTYIIQQIVSKYKGKLDYSYDANQMTILVTLPIVTNKKSNSGIDS